MRKKIVWFFSISVFTILFCLFSIQFLDKPITLFFYGLFYKSEPTFFTRFFDWIKGGIYIDHLLLQGFIPVVLISLVFRKWKFALQLSFLFCTNIVVTILTFYLKRFFARIRPFVFIENGDYNFYFNNSPPYYELPKTSYAFDWCDGIGCYESFPSGHTSSVFWLAFSVGLLFPKLRIPLLIYAVLIALARVFTTIHYFSDIIFGGFIAFFVVYMSYDFLVFLCRKLKI